jgi:DNA-binding SARP family transcriptional activator
MAGSARAPAHSTLDDSTNRDPSVRLSLFGGFALLRNAESVPLPQALQRLVAVVSLRATVTREQVSGILWPEVSDARAGARLRTALWRLHQAGDGVLRAADGRLSLAPHVDVDVRSWTGLALSILDRPAVVSMLDLSALRPGGDLLPGWYDDWVLLERERIRQLQLHVLELATHELLRSGRYAAALDLALTALQMEQTRESAHRLVIRVHLAEGNAGEAWRQYERCRDVLARELGVAPSEQLRAML